MFDACWDARVLAGRARPRRRRQRPAASVAKRPACGTAAPPAKRKRGQQRPAASYPPAGPMPGASRRGLVAGLETYEKYTTGAAWPCSSAGPIIRVGSDCSGMDAPKAALDLMGLGQRVQCCFCSDKEPACRRFLKVAHAPKI